MMDYLYSVGVFLDKGTHATAAVALLALFTAWVTIGVQRSIAQRRAAIDFLLKTEMDEKMLEAYKRYKTAVGLLAAAPDIAVFANSTDCEPVLTYLNIHELMAVGIRRGVFHQGVCKLYWIGELERACTKCNRLLLHLRQDPNEKFTYSEMRWLHSKWQRGY